MQMELLGYRKMHKFSFNRYCQTVLQAIVPIYIPTSRVTVLYLLQLLILEAILAILIDIYWYLTVIQTYIPNDWVWAIFCLLVSWMSYFIKCLLKYCANVKLHLLFILFYFILCMGYLLDWVYIYFQCFPLLSVLFVSSFRYHLPQGHEDILNIIFYKLYLL